MATSSSTACRGCNRSGRCSFRFRNLVSAAADALGNLYVIDAPKMGGPAILVFPPGASKPSRSIKGN